MYIKRISALMLALVMLLTLAGCGENEAEDTVLAEYHGFEITQSIVDTQKRYIQQFNDSIEVENTLSLAPKDDSTDAQMKALEKAAGIESTQNESNYPVIIGGVALCCIFAALSVTGYVRAKKRQKQLEKELEKFTED